MKRIFFTIALATALMFPIMAQSDPWYIVKNVEGAEIRSRAHGEGKVKCTIPVRKYVVRSKGENWSRWIYVQWRKFGWDWNARDVDGSHCPDWNRHGWMDKRDLHSLAAPP